MLSEEAFIHGRTFSVGRFQTLPPNRLDKNRAIHSWKEGVHRPGPYQGELSWRISFPGLEKTVLYSQNLVCGS